MNWCFFLYLYLFLFLLYITICLMFFFFFHFNWNKNKEEKKACISILLFSLSFIPFHLFHSTFSWHRISCVFRSHRSYFMFGFCQIDKDNIDVSFVCTACVCVCVCFVFYLHSAVFSIPPSYFSNRRRQRWKFMPA